MSQYIRTFYPAGTYFFTLVTFERRKILTTPIARRVLKEAWVRVQKKYPFHVDAVCLLPDHLHCILTLPEGESNFSIRWRAIKGIFSREFRKQVNIDNIPQCISRMKRNELPVWQRRFWEHAIRDHHDYHRHVDYIHYNPVKHGLCDRVRDWPWSSYHQYVRKGLYPNGWDADTDTLNGLETTGE